MGDYEIVAGPAARRPSSCPSGSVPYRKEVPGKIGTSLDPVPFSGTA